MDKLEELEKELTKYKKKLTQMTEDWGATKAGSRYGDEYLEVQIKVYRSMVESLRREIVDLKRKKA